ncbi:hypothetical protein V8C37DRAFT_344737 [Trichoderma ceciliae]
MKGLAYIKDFTLQIANSSTTKQAIRDLNLLVLTFSFNTAKVHPPIFDRHADLDTLYAGKGGIIVKLEEAVAHAEVVLPLYSDIPLNAS